MENSPVCGFCGRSGAVLSYSEVGKEIYRCTNMESCQQERVRQLKAQGLWHGPDELARRGPQAPMEVSKELSRNFCHKCHKPVGLVSLLYQTPEDMLREGIEGLQRGDQVWCFDCLLAGGYWEGWNKKRVDALKGIQPKGPRTP